MADKKHYPPEEDNLCRVCMVKTGKKRNGPTIFDQIEDGVKIHQFLEQICHLQNLANDAFTKKICKKCADEITFLYTSLERLKSKSKESEEKLKAMVIPHKIEIVDVDIKEESEDDDGNGFDFHDSMFPPPAQETPDDPDVKFDQTQDLKLLEMLPMKPNTPAPPLKAARKKKQTTAKIAKGKQKTNLRARKEPTKEKKVPSNLYKRLPNVMYCCKCTETFENDQELLGHFNYVHYDSIVTNYLPMPGDEGKSPCPLCKALVTCLRKHTRRRHYTQHAPREVTCECRVCGRPFKCYSARRNCEVRHQEERDKIIYNCTQCDHTFKSNYAWRHHMRHAHKEKPQYNCELCGEVTGSLKKFEFHMLKHTRIYYCDVCQKAFKRKDELQVHLLRHFSRRDHQCHLCTKAFICATELKRHISIHMKHIARAAANQSFDPKLVPGATLRT